MKDCECIQSCICVSYVYVRLRHGSRIRGLFEWSRLLALNQNTSTSHESLGNT